MQIFNPVKKALKSVQLSKRNSASVDAASVGAAAASLQEFVAFDGARVARAEPLPAAAASVAVASVAIQEDQEGQISSRQVESAAGVGVLPESHAELEMTAVSRSVDTETASLPSKIRYDVQLWQPWHYNGDLLWAWLDFSQGPAGWDYKPGVIGAQSVNAGRFECNGQVGGGVNSQTLRELPLGHVLCIQQLMVYPNNVIIYASPPRIHPYALSRAEQEILKKRGIFEEPGLVSDFWASKPFPYELRIAPWMIMVMQYIDNILITMVAHRKFSFVNEGRHLAVELNIPDYSDFVLRNWKNLDGKELFLRTLAFCLNKQEAFEQSRIAVRLGCSADQDLLRQYTADREDMDAILKRFGYSKQPIPKPGIAKRLEQFAKRHAPSEPRTTAEPETYYSM